MQKNITFQNSIVIDTIILLLLIVGSVERELIPSFKRTDQYSVQDYDILRNFLSEFNTKIVTPNILTEVSNLLGQLAKPKRNIAMSHLKNLIMDFIEVYTESAIISKLEHFIPLGLTDSDLFYSELEDFVFLTDDFKLSGKLTKAGREAINFKHLRTF